MHVPWLDASRGLVGPPRFICDVMTEGLARQLRMVGFDAESLAARHKTQRHAIYRRVGRGRCMDACDAPGAS